MATYPPIGDYALLADCFSAALVSTVGSIDWACFRRFDTGSSFGRLLDWQRGGHFSITPAKVVRTQRRYVPASLVLETEFRTEFGRARLTDVLAMAEDRGDDPPHGGGPVAADTTRWRLVHLAAGVASGLVILAFLAIRTHLRDAGDHRLSAVGVPFVIVGNTLFAMLPGMGFAALAAAETGRTWRISPPPKRPLRRGSCPCWLSVRSPSGSASSPSSGASPPRGS